MTESSGDSRPATLADDCPLVVDLDGTLIKSDLLHESLAALIRKNPLYLLVLPIWLLAGKAGFKARIAKRVTLNVTLLPYRKKVISWLESEKKNGRQLILATASHRLLAEPVAAHLSLFDRIHATSDEHNLLGRHKLEALVEDLGNEFDYAGDSRADLVIWQKARKAFLVSPSPSIQRLAEQNHNVETILAPRTQGILSNALPLLKAVRPHQWVKNLLVFLPLLTSHSWGNSEALLLAVLAFVAFSLAASSMYLLNDLLDIESDRAHPSKSRRPFAAGTASPIHGVVLMVIFLVLATICGTLVSEFFLALLCCYLILTCLYSFLLKKHTIIDVITLAGLYTLRVIAGAAAISVSLSFWLLAFSMFIFLSLALIKRCTELRGKAQNLQPGTSGRGYIVSDLDQLYRMGVSSGYMSILVLALFIHSPEVSERYSNPQALWLLCPLWLYWISKIWLQTGRGEVDDDPIVHSLRDPTGWVTGIMSILTVYLAL